MSSRRTASILAAILLVTAACTSGAPGSASPGASDPPASGTDPSAGSSGGPGASSGPPTADATGAPTSAPTCSPGPLTVAQFLAADPRCYLDADVTVVGWSSRTDGRDPEGTGYPLSVALRGAVPFWSDTADAAAHLFLDPQEGAFAALPDAPAWVQVTGRRSPADARICYLSDGPYGTRGELALRTPVCPEHLDVRAVVEAAPPASALSACPAAGSGRFTAESFVAWPPACFGSRDVTIRDWLEVEFLVAGWEAPYAMTPQWLWRPIGPWLVLGDRGGLKLWFDPARRLTVGHTDRFVIVTGHYADPAAATCRYVYFDEQTGAPLASPPPGMGLDDADARRGCRDRFVVTSIVTDPDYFDFVP